MKEVCETKDKIEKIKLVTTCMIAGMHVGMSVLHSLSPLNPVLGETCQRFATDGTQYFAEQITHHPPVSAATMIGPGGSWKFEVIQEFKAGLVSPNTIQAYKQGALVITLEDDTQYVIEEAQLNISGLVVGEIVLANSGKVTVKDITNDITAEVILDPDRQEGYISSVASKLKFWGSKKTKRPSDHFDINIYEGEIDKENIACQGKGSYLEYVEFEDEKYWEIGEEWEEWKKPDILLQSDSSLRTDLNYIIKKDYVNAQEAKEAIEEAQRADKKLRESAKK